MTHDAGHQAAVILEAHVRAAIERLALQQFSTKRLIAELRSDPAGESAYQEALAMCSAGDEPDRMAYLVVHGQAIPEALRGSELVRFAGFIHGDPDQDDGYSVPSWWRKV